MRRTQEVLVGIAFVFAISFISRAQTSAETVQSIQATDSIAFQLLEENGDSAGSGKAYGADTNLLFLEITNVANGTAYLNLHNPTNQVYAIWGATNLPAVWNVETEVWPTDTNCTPFTVPTRDRPNLFLQAEDWTGVDENANGIPDWWEWKYFGRLDVDADADPDGDGFSNAQEFYAGADPTDFYNGVLPTIAIVSGDYQRGRADEFLPAALTVRVLDPQSVPLINAPVSFTVTGSGRLAVSFGAPAVSQLQLRTGNSGEISVWLQQFTAGETNFVIATVQSGTNIAQTVFTETAGRFPQIAIGGEWIMELTAPGDVVSWGGSRFGEFGDYTHVDSTNPVHVVGLTNVVKISSGKLCSLAIDTEGNLWVWGDNRAGQFGNGTFDDGTNRPIRVVGLSNVVDITASYLPYWSDPLAITGDGSVWEWGESLGSLPIKVVGISNAVAVAAVDRTALALLNDGTVVAWAPWNLTDAPVPVPGLSNIVAICYGDMHSLVLDVHGQVWAWGYNNYGQLGDGGFEYYTDQPVLVAGLTNVIKIAAGAAHSLALDGEGRLWAWGSDSAGQLGDGGLVNKTNLPVQVFGLSNIVVIAAGSDASAAVDADNRIWQWGKSETLTYGYGWVAWSWGDATGRPAPAPRYTDFYNGQPPRLQIVSGNHQSSHAGMEFVQPLVVKITDGNGVALSNAPVSVEVIASAMELRATSGGSDHKGLRLTADANGEVQFIGMADHDYDNSNCLVRVLAASREQIVETDFYETIVPLPTVAITRPGDGSVNLVGLNQGLILTADAEVSGGALIQEVDYYCQTNGGNPTLIGVSTLANESFAFIWTNSLWWTNAFIGQYTLSAVAIDDTGAQSDPASINITVVLDSDGVGLPDYWQIQYFGQLGIDPEADSDSDGISNLQEFLNGTDPTDFYNGNLPVLEIIGGNDQAGRYNSFLLQPIRVRVRHHGEWGVLFGELWTNAPVTFVVTNGTVLLAATTNDAPSASLVLRTDTHGEVAVWGYFPPATAAPPDSVILVQAISASNSTSVAVNEYVPLGHWTFNDTNTWVGESGQLPIVTGNLMGVSSWSSNAVLVDEVDPALMAYHVVEINGSTNLSCQTGSVLFWFKPDWASANLGGSGPGVWGRLIEIGRYSPGFTDGWWSLYFNPDGTKLFFSTSTNSYGLTNLTANISWYSNEWYQIALTYSPAECVLYVNGQRLANRPGVTCYPDANELTNGFRIGSDENGNNQAGGAFDELQTFGYPLAAAKAVTCSGEIPDWWLIKYFGRTGMDPNSVPFGKSKTLLRYYQDGIDPTGIDFTIVTTNRYVNTNAVPVKVNVSSGEPIYMAVVVRTNDFTVPREQLFDITSNLTATAWQPFASNPVVSLGSMDGVYHVWVGLKSQAPEAQWTWAETVVELDTIPPVLVITNPASGVVSRPVIQLQGGANEFLSSVSYDVSNADGTWTNQTGYVTGQFYDASLQAITTNWFQCFNVALSRNGLNAITLHATDLAGNTATMELGVTYDATSDTNPPTMTSVWPPDGAYISGANFTWEGRVSDPLANLTGFIVDTNGVTHTVRGLVEQSGRAWIENLPLAGGANALSVIVSDSTGNAVTNQLTLLRSSVIVGMNPLAADQLNRSSVTVTGAISDPGSSLTVNGVPVAVNADGTWEVDNVPVSSSGKADFDVEVSQGGYALAGLQHSSRSRPLEGDPSLGSQHFSQALPVKVGWMSYIGHHAYNDVMYHLLNGDCPTYGIFTGAPWCNMEDTLNWCYASGGSDVGFYDFSGYNHCWISLDPGPKVGWNDQISGGDNGPVQDENSRLLFSLRWENTTFSMPITDGDVGNYREDVKTHVQLEPSGKMAAGGMVTYVVQAQGWDVLNGDPLPPDSMQIRGVTLMPVTNSDGSVWGQTLVSAPAGVNVDVTPESSGNYSFDVQAYSSDLQLAVDNNRDGNITLDGADQTSASQPYRFWINDSKESGDDESSGGADDQIPGQSYFNANYSLTHVNGRSDLVNFFPVVLCLSNVLQWLPPTNGFEYHLVQNDSAVKFVYTSLTPTNAFDYLTNTASFGYGTNSNEWVTNADTIQVRNTPGTVLDTNWLAQVQSNGGNGVILVEGCVATTQPLMLEIWRMGQNIGSVPLYLSINGVEHMFRHYNMCAYGNGAVDTGNPGNPSRYDAPNEPVTNGKNLVFLPGYNVNQQQSRGVESEMFKRFYWSGSKAKFYGVTWNGAESQITSVSFTPNFHTNVVNALQTAPHLASFLNVLPGETTVTAHSLGNMVVLSAISDWSATHIAHYFMIDSAVPIESLQGNTTNEPTMIHPAWQQDSAGQPYDQRLYASDWWQLFTNDYRSTLTWSNRLGNLRNVDIYNFYSSGEEILRKSSGPIPASISGAVWQEVYDHYLTWFGGAGLPFGTYGWTWQELGKGTFSSDTFIGSTHGGWAFAVNTNYYYPDVNGVEVPVLAPPSYWSHMSDSQASQVPDSQLRTNAFFDFTSANIQKCGIIFAADTADLSLYGSGGSAYAQANRDRILSDAIPALTLPVGANFVFLLDERAADKRNFDMQVEFQNGWPAARLADVREYNKWHHSDFDYVAYPFTHKLFDNIVNTGRLK